MQLFDYHRHQSEHSLGPENPRGRIVALRVCAIDELVQKRDPRRVQCLNLPNIQAGLAWSGFGCGETLVE